LQNHREVQESPEYLKISEIQCSTRVYTNNMHQVMTQQFPHETHASKTSKRLSSTYTSCSANDIMYLVSSMRTTIGENDDLLEKLLQLDEARPKSLVEYLVR